MPATIIFSNMSADSVRGPIVQIIFVRLTLGLTVARRSGKEKIANARRQNYASHHYARGFMPKIAVYPGSFDPITNGHLDVIHRAAKMFDRVIVAVASNGEKSPLFSVAEREALARGAVRGLRNVSVDHFGGLLVRYARRKQATVVVRGLRAVSDFEFEFQMALMNRKLDEMIETIFLMPKDEYTFISSHLVRESAGLGGTVSGFVPRIVERALKQKLAR
jgi:pantetheine-phosphate adenylyltransferase